MKISLTRWFMSALNCFDCPTADFRYLHDVYYSGRDPLVDLDEFFDEDFVRDVLIPLSELIPSCVDITVPNGKSFLTIRADPTILLDGDLTNTEVTIFGKEYGMIVKPPWVSLSQDDLPYLDGIVVSRFKFGFLFDCPERLAIGQLRFS